MLAGALAYPLFGNVDEQMHYDLVVRYARGTWPSGFLRFQEETARVCAAYGSWEFLNAPRTVASLDEAVPTWKLPPPRRQALLDRRRREWLAEVNRESLEPPAYYLTAAAWLRAGEPAGLRGARGAFWIRALNALLYAATLLVAAGLARARYPDRPSVRWGVPVLLAAMPQDVYYSINNDVAPALGCGAGLALLAGGPAAPRPAAAALGGVCLGFAALSKYPALPVAVAVGLAPWCAAGRRGLAPTGISLSTLAALVGAWWVRNLAAGGFVTGYGAKVGLMGWTRQSPAGIIAHPVFTPAGAWTFVRDLVPSFWRGGLVWHGELPDPPVLDALYLTLTVVGLAGAGLGAVTGRSGAPRSVRLRRRFEGACLLALAAAVAPLVLGSVAYDFGRFYSPSREYPFITMGRLAEGALVPFTLALAAGLDRIAGRPRSGRWIIAAMLAVAAAATAAEAVTLRRVARSEFNWFHLP